MGVRVGGRGGGGGFLKSHSLSQKTRLECVDRKKLVRIGLFEGRGGAWSGGGGLYGPGKKKSKDAPRTSRLLDSLKGFQACWRAKET